MTAIQERLISIIKDQPEDSSIDEIMQELIIEQMVEHGLADVREGRIISNEEMLTRIRSWKK